MRRQLVIFAFIVLVLAVANLIVAILAMPSPRTRAGTMVANLFGPEAAAAGWPTAPPLEWPAVTQWDDRRAFAYRERNAWSAVPPQQTTHQMEFQEFGWPLPVLEHTQLWWPWDDPAWATTVPNDSGIQINWTGVIVNPLLGASALWLVLLGPFVLWSTLRRRRRHARGQCLACAYPLGGAAICPECGWRAQARAA